jgi:hypothetical protein
VKSEDDFGSRQSLSIWQSMTRNWLGWVLMIVGIYVAHRAAQSLPGSWLFWIAGISAAVGFLLVAPERVAKHLPYPVAAVGLFLTVFGIALFAFAFISLPS